MRASDRPLDGVRVVEVCQIASGPFCGMLLGDLGADVVKVEPPGGDAMRAWPPLSDGYSENFASINRGKKSVVLDLKDANEVAIARRLILDSDVVIENNRPGVMQRLGLGWDYFRTRRPELVYCSISAYGQSGPRSTTGGFDLTIQASAGLMSVTGMPDGPPVKSGVPIADFAVGLYGALSVASLIARVRSGGRGGWIDVSMFSAALAISALQVSQYFGTGRDPGPLGSAHPRNAPYKTFQARDGFFALAAGNDHLWQLVCEAVGRPGLAGDPRFASTSRRAEHQAELDSILAPCFAQRSVQEWLDVFDAARVPCAPINRYSQALADEQTEYLGLVQPAELPNGQLTQTVVSPVRIDGCGLPVDTTPPELGAHTDQVIARLSTRLVAEQ